MFVLLVVITLLIAAPHFGPIFPQTNPDSPDAQGPTPGFVWIYVVIVACSFATGIIMVLYETVATARFGRTLGKAWLRIRPLGVDGATLGWARSFGRALTGWLAWFLSWIGLLDPLWCLWDDKHQCVHDENCRLDRRQ